MNPTSSFFIAVILFFNFACSLRDHSKNPEPLSKASGPSPIAPSTVPTTQSQVPSHAPTTQSQVPSHAPTTQSQAPSHPQTGIQSESNTLKSVNEMAVLGDSIGVGFLVDTELGVKPLDSSPIFTKFLQPILPQVFVGITADAFIRQISILSRHYRDSYQSAFIGNMSKINGQDCFSLACKLNLKANQTHNYSVAGYQIDNILSESERLSATVDLIIIEIGANDFCSISYDQNVFLTRYQKLVDKLKEHPNNPVVLFIPIPNIPHVFKTAPAKTDNFEFFFDFNCGDIRDGLQFGNDNSFCPRFANANSTFLTRASQQISDLNSAVKTIIDKAELPDRFFYASELNDWSIQKSELAADCFHPNLKAHKKISDLSWKVISKSIQGKGP